MKSHTENPECTDTGSWKPALVPGSWMDFSECLFLHIYVNVDLSSAVLVHLGVTKHDGISLPI